MGIIKNLRPVKMTDKVLAWLSPWSNVQMACIWCSWCHCYNPRFIKIENGLSFWCWSGKDTKMGVCQVLYTHIITSNECSLPILLSMQLHALLVRYISEMLTKMQQRRMKKLFIYQLQLLILVLNRYRISVIEYSKRCSIGECDISVCVSLPIPTGLL